MHISGMKDMFTIVQTRRLTCNPLVCRLKHLKVSRRLIFIPYDKCNVGCCFYLHVLRLSWVWPHVKRDWK